MNDRTEHRLTKLETQNEHILEKLGSIETDLKPIKKHVLTLNLILKISTSTAAVMIIKKLLEHM